MVNVSKLRAKSVSSLVNSLRSDGTRKNYYSTLKNYFEFIKPGLSEIPDRVDGKLNPDKVQAIDEVSLEYVKDPEVKTMTGEINYEEDLRRYRDEVLVNHAESSKKYKFRVIFRYLGSNQIEFDKTFMANIVGKGRPVTSQVEMIPTPTQFDNLLDRIHPAARAALGLMAKAGLRPEEVLIAKLSDLDFNFVAEYVDSQTGREMSVPIAKLDIPKAKGDQPRFVFLIKEVEDELKEWLKRRPEYLNKLQSHSEYSDRDPDEEQIFPYGESTLRSMWETALGKCGMAQRETITQMNRNRLVYRLHNLRKFFRTYGQWKNPDVAEALMGHQEGMSKIYARMDKAMELMVKGIRQAEPHLTSRRLRAHDFDDLREENEQLRFNLAKLTEDMNKLGEQAEIKNQRLRTKLEQTQIDFRQEMEEQRASMITGLSPNMKAGLTELLLLLEHPEAKEKLLGASRELGEKRKT